MMDALTGDGEPTVYNYESIKELAKRTVRKVETLLSMAAIHDPFYAGRPIRRERAEWFEALWKQHCASRRNMHIRAIHYLLISVAIPPRIVGDQSLYVNTEDCYFMLCQACRDARLLNLVPFDRIDDERSDKPIEHLPDFDKPDASVSITDREVPEADVGSPPAIQRSLSVLPEDPIKPLRVWGLSNAPDLLEMPVEVDAPDVPEVTVNELLIPSVSLSPPSVTPPWFHIEIWYEKTTMNSILLAIAQERRLNLITGPGYQSQTSCHLLIERAKRSRRPVRILYISDFDPAGQNMPAQVARIIEFILRRDKLDLDIKLTPVALTYDQCIEYELPRTPLKQSANGKESFEGRYGEGATELDALEAIRPGELRRILLREIDRHADPTFPDRMRAEEERLQGDLERIREDDVVTLYREELDELIAKQQQLIDERKEEIEIFAAEEVAALNSRIEEPAGERVESMNERLAEVQEEVEAIDEEIAEVYGPRLEPLNAVIDEVAPQAQALDDEVSRMGEEGIAEINRGIREIVDRYESELAEVAAEIEAVLDNIQDQLEEATSTVLNDAEWPQPEEIESVEPLFDSSRSYLEQMAKYKAHLGKDDDEPAERSDKGVPRKRFLKPRGQP